MMHKCGAHNDFEQDYHVYRIHERKEKRKQYRGLERFLAETAVLRDELETERNLKPWWRFW